MALAYSRTCFRVAFNPLVSPLATTTVPFDSICRSCSSYAFIVQPTVIKLYTRRGEGCRGLVVVWGCPVLIFAYNFFLSLSLEWDMRRRTALLQPGYNCWCKKKFYQLFKGIFYLILSFSIDPHIESSSRGF